MSDRLSDVRAYYDRFAEEDRLRCREGRLEFERTVDILTRHLPPPPACVVDVGGGPGVHAVWLAERGYEMHLVDASERLLEHARRLNAALAKPIASLTLGDARSLHLPDRFADAVIVMGPLYHLIDPGDRRMFDALVAAARA